MLGTQTGIAMTNSKLIFIVSAFLFLLIGGCNKNTITPGTKVRTHTVTINWFRDSTTTNPTSFVDLYNGKAHNIANAAAKADSIDLFIHDNSALPVSGNALTVVNMVFFGTNNYPAYTQFNNVVGVIPFSNYNASLVSEISLLPSAFTNITYNADIASLFSSLSLNGGYTDISIVASDLTSTKYYQFKCAKTGKRGFFHVVSSNYLPGGTMTIEIKVEE